MTEATAAGHGSQSQRPHAVGLPRAESIIWIFGFARSGSSWLARMMAALPDHVLWNEPLVGELFGDFFYRKRGQDRGSAFFLAPEHRAVWARGIRELVLEGAAARKRRLGPDGYLVIKEPHGSIGAPLMSTALPESRFVLMVRDPRDMVASAIDAHREGGWVSQGPMLARTADVHGREDAWHPSVALHGKGFHDQLRLAREDLDEFVRFRCELIGIHVGQARAAHAAHPGPKAIVRYEDLRAAPLAELERVYAELGIPVGADDLAAAVADQDWERLPESDRGPGKKFRRAEPGGWRDELSPAHARRVEQLTAAILSEFYPG